MTNQPAADVPPPTVLDDSTAYQVAWQTQDAHDHARRGKRRCAWTLQLTGYGTEDQADAVARRMAASPGIHAVRVMKTRTTTTVIRTYPGPHRT